MGARQSRSAACLGQDVNPTPPHMAGSACVQRGGPITLRKDVMVAGSDAVQRDWLGWNRVGRRKHAQAIGTAP